MGKMILKANQRVVELAYQLIKQAENQVMECHYISNGQRLNFNFTTDDSCYIVVVLIKKTGNNPMMLY